MRQALKSPATILKVALTFKNLHRYLDKCTDLDDEKVWYISLKNPPRSRKVGEWEGHRSLSKAHLDLLKTNNFNLKKST